MQPFFYHRNKTGQKKATFAGVVNEEDNQLRIGLSICNPKDNFCKKIGRLIAEGRACKKPEQIIDLTGVPGKDYCDKFVEFCKSKELWDIKR